MHIHTGTEFHKKFMSVRCTMTDHAALYQVDLYYRTHVEARKNGADVGSLRHGALCRTSDGYVRLVLTSGPAGAGKSTFCASLMAHAHSLGRNMHLFNLDPAAERFEYEPTIDIRELISLEDVMEEMELGPNGGLIYCFDYLLNNLDWLETELGEYDNDYLVIDCPGQIELYTHFPVISRFVELMQQQFHFRVCATYLLDSHFIDDKAKYFAGVLSAMSAMINLDISHLNIMTKMDLVAQHEKEGLSYAQRREIERYMEPDPLLFADQDESLNNARFHALNQAVVQLIEDYSMVSFLPLDLSSEESINLIFSCIDNVLQFGEDEEPVEPKDLENEDTNE